MLNRKREKNGWYILFTVIFLLLLACLCVMTWVSWSVMEVTVSGQSMESTLHSGDVVYASKSKKAERGDIVIIDVGGYDGLFEKSTLIKRLIATEGDVIRCERGVVSVCYAGEEEFTVLDEPYIKDATVDYSFEEVTVGEGEIFFMGDNRGNSTDSRKVGCLKYGDIIGVVLDWSLEGKVKLNRFDLTLHYFGLK